MKKIFVLVFTLSLAIMASYAQMQQGIVKTRGRMVNGVLQPGVGLAGATVRVTGGQAVVSKGAGGKFSIPVRGQKYRVENVQKQGYQLVDYSVCTEYKYSENPLRLVMETPEQQQSDQLAVERKIRRNLQRQLQQKEDEIESLQVSQQQKDSLLRILYQQQSDNEKLIADMAKRYSTLDYDQLDEFYRQVSWFIENGELTRADSLLRTRGDIKTQVQSIIEQGQAIHEQKEQIQKAENVHQTDIDEASRRCYGYYETFSAQHQNDSAAYYLELRASLDTTKVEWSYETGRFIETYMANYHKALEYYQRVLRQSLLQHGVQDDWVATAYNEIGVVYYNQGEYPKALEYYTKALAIWEKVFGTEHPDVARIYNNIGGVYLRQGDIPKALEYSTKAFAIWEKVLDPEHPDVAISYHNIGCVYSGQGDYHKALEYYTKALVIQEKVFGAEHPDVATSYNSIGIAYDWLDDYSQALVYYSKALVIQENVFGAEHPDVAQSYNNIGSVYKNQGDYPKALEYHLKALAICEKVLGKEHPDVAASYNNIGHVYSEQSDYPKALEYYLKALAIREKVLGQEHPETRTIRENVEYVKEAMIVQDPVAMQDYVFTATVVDGDTPARQQGLSGEYIMLEFADWTIKDTTSLYKKNDEMRGKPKDIVIIKDNIISQHNFENTIGVQFGLKQVGKEEKERIIQAYEQWKKEHQQ